MKKMVERRASILPIESKLKLRVLEDDEIRNIHETTLGILENTGVSFPSQKALEILVDAGAKVDFRSQIVKLPHDMVMDYVKKVPRYYRLAARGGRELDLTLNDKQTFFSTSSAAVTTVDLKTGEKRATCKEDVAMMATIIDFLPSVSFYYGPLASAQDKRKTAPLHELDAAFNNTEKHFMAETLIGENLARFAIEMASIIVGGKRNLRQRPILSALICTLAPLGQDRESIEAALVFAEAGIPVGFMSMPTLGITAPASSAGALVVGMAEILSSIVLLQIAYPGAPVFSSLGPGTIDPRSGEYFYGSSLGQITNASAIQLSHFYGIPIFAGASFGGSGYELDRWQVGRENVYLPLLSILLGAEMALGLGLMDAATLLYPERVLFDQEMTQCISQISAGIEVNSETLARDMISQVGPRGHYLGEEHTRENLPTLWPSSILTEKSHQKGQRFRTPREVAREQVEWILTNHAPAQLDEKVKAEMKKLLETAEKEIG